MGQHWLKLITMPVMDTEMAGTDLWIQWNKSDASDG